MNTSSARPNSRKLRNLEHERFASHRAERWPNVAFLALKSAVSFPVSLKKNHFVSKRPGIIGRETARSCASNPVYLAANLRPHTEPNLLAGESPRLNFTSTRIIRGSEPLDGKSPGYRNSMRARILSHREGGSTQVRTQGSCCRLAIQA